MTRIVFWNVDKFKETKVNDPVAAPPPGGAVNRDVMASDRLALMLDTWNAADPDIIVVVEVAAGKSNHGRLALNTGGVSGGVFLLHLLRYGMLPMCSPEWRLVPPFWIAGTGDAGLETALVFFRGSRNLGGGATLTRWFTGPDIWPGGMDNTPRRTGTAAPGAYTVLRGPAGIDINAMLVPPGTAARTIPAGAQYNNNGATAENTVAARFAYYQLPLTVPPTRVNFLTGVPPLMCTFFEDDGVAQRNLTLFTVHLPSDSARGDTFMATLGTTPDIVGPLGGNETRVVGGDFNINLLDPAFALTNRYQPLTGAGYTLLLTPAGPPPPDTSAYKGYFGTHVNSVDATDLGNLAATRFLWSAGPAPDELSHYPGYNYFSRDFYSLDNILVRPAQPPPHDYRATVLNYVTGAPYDRVLPTPGAAPQGSVPLATGIGEPGWPPAPTAPAYVQADALRLAGWNNYGRMYSISDHLPISADV